MMRKINQNAFFMNYLQCIFIKKDLLVRYIENLFGNEDDFQNSNNPIQIGITR